MVGTPSCELPVRVSVFETVVEPRPTPTGAIDLVAFEAVETLEPCGEAEDCEAAIEIVDDIDFSSDVAESLRSA